MTALSTLDGPTRLKSVTGATGRHPVATVKTALAARDAGSGRPSPRRRQRPVGYLPSTPSASRRRRSATRRAQLHRAGVRQFGGKTYTRIGVDSNGYIDPGGSAGATTSTSQPQTLPDPAPPNNVLAPYWTDLDGTGAPGIFVGDA